MKHLTKSSPPEILSTKVESWTAAYIASGGKTAPWSHEEIKAALIKETSGKCAYCEARMLAVSFGDIEHIFPKSKFPALVVAWENLTLACSRCNLRKSSKHDPNLEFINPYVDDPNEHLFFLGPAVYDRTPRGMHTIRELGLNEIPRIEARMRAIDNVANLVARLTLAGDSSNQKLLEDLIRNVVEEGEYTAAVSTYVFVATRTSPTVEQKIVPEVS